MKVLMFLPLAAAAIAIPDPEWQAFKHKYQKILSFKLSRSRFERLQAG